MKELELPAWMDRVLKDIGDDTPRTIRVENKDILEELDINRKQDVLEELSEDI